MICRDRKIIFIHIPKCGGTSIENIIWSAPRSERTTDDLWGGIVKGMSNPYQTGGLQHLTAQHVRTAVGQEMFEQCFRFTVVRDPLKRIVSQYRYMATRPPLRRYIGMKRDDDFGTYLDRTQAREHVQWMPQHLFLTDTDGSLLVDKIYRLETLSQDVTDLSDRLDLGIDTLPHANKSASSKLKLTREDVERVFEIYAADYDLLDYPRESHGLIADA